ncbi:hypothetical protein SLEP1_g35357 [Rubroshorea leprosula]|uniref:Uncharacterized protein n=1 Tax=Rubroshorea leprosula TaxID=152421 RepID=A0AAV5KN04_9ROSI|nr:hypothetical protein SLEP1_g35357 [Rubroshorea leprosula]
MTYSGDVYFVPVLFWDLNKFRTLCICGTRLTSARRLSRLGFGFWGMTDLVPMDLRTVVRRVMGLYKGQV